jgi:cell wall assembly regulator SMI1
MGGARWRPTEEAEEKMRNLAELNINEGGGPINRPPPTPEVIAAFEHEFNVSLPQEYVELLRHSNGGHPQADIVVEPQGIEYSNWAVNHFCYLNEDQTGFHSLWRTTREWRQVLPEKLIPIAADGGGNPFVLDTSSAPARVLVFDHEDWELIELAPSFEDFINRLEINPEDA